MRHVHTLIVRVEIDCFAAACMIARSVRVSFAAGDLGFNFIWQSIELYRRTPRFRVRPELATASAIFLAGALIDFLVDPLVGIIVDRAASRVGMRSWVVIGGSAASVALIVAFAQPQLAALPAAAYALAAHLVLRIAYSIGNIPYGARPPASRARRLTRWR